MSHTYGEKPSDFKVGDRVELHPATDLWMRGCRFGEVVKIGRRYVHIKLDARVAGLHRTALVPPSLVRHLDSCDG